MKKILSIIIALMFLIYSDDSFTDDRSANKTAINVAGGSYEIPSSWIIVENNSQIFQGYTSRYEIYILVRTFRDISPGDDMNDQRLNANVLLWQVVNRLYQDYGIAITSTGDISTYESRGNSRARDSYLPFYLFHGWNAWPPDIPDESLRYYLGIKKDGNAITVILATGYQQYFRVHESALFDFFDQFQGQR